MTTAYLCSSSLPKSKYLINWVLRVKETTKAHKINKRIILIELTLTCQSLALFLCAVVVPNFYMFSFGGLCRKRCP